MVFILFLWFFILTKNLFFWLWLWQLKEYHLARFWAHFETEALKKFLFSFWRVKFPVFTKKIIILSVLGIFLEILFLVFLLSLSLPEPFFLFWLLGMFFFSPFIFSLLILAFQIPTAIFKIWFLKKAQRKREKFFSVEYPAEFATAIKEEKKGLLAIGITGSYGKTSTKEFLAAILSEKFGKDKILKTKEHQNSEMGIAQCILKELNPEHKILVAEMAAYNKGGIKLLCELVKPKIGIITGINQQHLGVFGSMENLISAEGGNELIQGLPADGLAIFNGDNKIIQKVAKFLTESANSREIPDGICKNPPQSLPATLLRKCILSQNNVKCKNIKICSTKEKIDYWAEDIKVEKEFISFKVFSKDNDSAEFRVNLLGAQNVENILLAACCAKELGMSLREISQACQKLKPMPRQMELKKGLTGLNIINSTYSTNPTAVFSHLDYLKTWSGRKIIIMPCLIELGAASKEIHCQIGEKIAEICDLAIITNKGRFKEIKERAIKKIHSLDVDKQKLKKENILFINDPGEIYNKVKSFLESKVETKEDVVLLEGRISEKIIEKLQSTKGTK